jgi:hypothetical protein
MNLSFPFKKYKWLSPYDHRPPDPTANISTSKLCTKRPTTSLNIWYQVISEKTYKLVGKYFQITKHHSLERCYLTGVPDAQDGLLLLFTHPNSSSHIIKPIFLKVNTTSAGEDKHRLFYSLSISDFLITVAAWQDWFTRVSLNFWRLSLERHSQIHPFSPLHNRYVAKRRDLLFYWHILP